MKGREGSIGDQQNPAEGGGGGGECAHSDVSCRTCSPVPAVIGSVLAGKSLGIGNIGSLLHISEGDPPRGYSLHEF